MNDLKMHKAVYQKKGLAVLLLSFFLLSYIVPLGFRDLAVPDETRYGEIPREMIASGDWVVPRLNGVRYFEKPVLGYWIHAGSLLLFGENNFAVRLPSAVAVGLSALLIFLAVRRVMHNQEKDAGFAAVLAVLIYLSCFEVFGVGNTALLDSLFSFFLTACILAFYFATEELPGSTREKGFLLLAGLACGLAFLTKGFLACAVPVLTFVPYLIRQRRYTDLFRMSWLPILTAFVVALPWGILIHLREPDFWGYFFWNEHVRRFIGDNAQHKESFWPFLLKTPGMFIPWIWMVPAAVPGIRAQLHEHGQHTLLLKLCFWWLVLPLMFFSLSKGKLLTYILPCFPPFAILMAFGLLDVLRKEPRNRLFLGGAVVNAVLFGLILVAFVYVQFSGLNGFRPYSQSWKVLMVVSGLVFLVLFCLWSVRSRSAERKVILFGMAPLLFFFIVHYTIPDRVIEVKSPGPVLVQHGQDIADDDVIISDEGSVNAVCWYLKRSDVYVLGGPGELYWGLRYKDAQARWLDTKSAANLIKQNRGKTILVARARNITRWREQLPAPVFQDQSGPSGYVFRKY